MDALLKELPVTISKLKRLRTLDVSKNAKLKKLPKHLGHCHGLDKLIGPDQDIVQFPASSICNQGTEAVMRFLAKGKYAKFAFYCQITVMTPYKVPLLVP